MIFSMQTAWSNTLYAGRLFPSAVIMNFCSPTLRSYMLRSLPVCLVQEAIGSHLDDTPPAWRVMAAAHAEHCCPSPKPSQIPCLMQPHQSSLRSCVSTCRQLRPDDSRIVMELQKAEHKGRRKGKRQRSRIREEDPPPLPRPGLPRSTSVRVSKGGGVANLGTLTLWKSLGGLLADSPSHLSWALSQVSVVARPL